MLVTLMDGGTHRTGRDVISDSVWQTLWTQPATDVFGIRYMSAARRIMLTEVGVIFGRMATRTMRAVMNIRR